MQGMWVVLTSLVSVRVLTVDHNSTSKTQYREATACHEGFFGWECAYKCHCQDAPCSHWGVCKGQQRCAQGWFGPLCQIENMAYRSGKVPAPLTDNNDETCNEDLELTQVTIHGKFVFTWMWAVVRPTATDHLYDFDVQFDGQRKCLRKLQYEVSKSMVEIHCQVKEAQSYLVLSGEGVKSLCSLYISGGQNVALSPKTTSGFGRAQGHAYEKDKVLDGQFDTCMRSDEGAEPQWTVMFSRGYMVNRLVIYSKTEVGDLKGLTLYLIAHDSREQQVYSGNIRIRVGPLAAYTVTQHIEQPLQTLTIYVTGTNFLTLCEVEVYGEPVCNTGSHGLECENYCQCGDLPCFSLTSSCVARCPRGRTGPDCGKACSAGTFGPDCAQNCSQHCQKAGVCHLKSGRCSGGCRPGYEPPVCLQPCEGGFYGQNCTKQCPLQCVTGVCDSVTGQCPVCGQGDESSTCADTAGVGNLFLKWKMWLVVSFLFPACLFTGFLTHRRVYAIEQTTDSASPSSSSSSSSSSSLSSSQSSSLSTTYSSTYWDSRTDQPISTKSGETNVDTGRGFVHTEV